MIPEQNSPEWEKLRKRMIGASDVPIILGLSPYKSPYRLWLEKTGRKEPKLVGTRGHEIEEHIRHKVSDDLKRIFLPLVHFHDKHPMLMASLDGITMDQSTILEIKAISEEAYEHIKETNEIPPHHYAQIQIQLYCSPKTEFCYYVCTKFDFVNMPEEYHIVKVYADKQYQEGIIQRIYEFYDYMISDLPPPSNESDYIVIENDPEFAQAANSWMKARQALKEAQALEKQARDDLIALTDDGSCEGHGVSLRKSYRKTVDYKRACEDNNINTDIYTKESVPFWTLKEI